MVTYKRDKYIIYTLIVAKLAKLDAGQKARSTPCPKISPVSIAKKRALCAIIRVHSMILHYFSITQYKKIMSYFFRPRLQTFKLKVTS